MPNNDQIRCLIIDDDPFIQELLIDKFQLYFTELKVVGFANNGKVGLEKIASLQPELVFLDVEMDDMTGFEMLSQLKTINFKIIFITSYKHYAIKAIRFNALDYLLKPFDLEELKNAIRRFKKDVSNYSPVVLNNIKTTSPEEKTLILKTQQGELFLQLKTIVYISGERNYSYIHLVNGKKELISKTLSNLEELLEDTNFFRCHKSYLVNRTHFTSKPKSLEIPLSNNTVIPISRRKKDDFLVWYHSYNQ